MDKSGDKDDMLHPDKANGQQAHERARKPVILETLLLVIFLCIAGLSNPTHAKTAVLREVRMGNHGEYIRVVFEFSTAVQYELSENADTGNVSIRFLDTTSELKGAPVSDTLACIDAVSAVQDGKHIVTSISFDTKGIKLNPFMIQGPDRVVLDVYCEAEPVTAPRDISTAPRDISTEPRDISTESRDISTEPRDISTEPRDISTEPRDIPTAQQDIPPEPRDIPPEPIEVAEPAQEKPVATRPLVVEQTPTPEVTPKKEDASQRYLLLLLAAITGIIVLLIAVIIFQKISHSEHQTTGSPEAAKDADEMMQAIDTKIKEKLMKYDT